MLELNMNPSKRELHWFGLILLSFFAIVGGVTFRAFESATVAIVLWSLGLALCILFYSFRPIRRVLYRIWIRIFYPIGWVSSHLLFGIVFYLVFTPIGVIMRRAGYDPMTKHTKANAATYWTPRRSDARVGQYFRQF